MSDWSKLGYANTCVQQYASWDGTLIAMIDVYFDRFLIIYSDALPTLLSETSFKVISHIIVVESRYYVAKIN